MRAFEKLLKAQVKIVLTFIQFFVLLINKHNFISFYLAFIESREE